MKLSNISLLSAAVVAMAAASCSDDGYWNEAAEATASAAEATFQQTAVSVAATNDNGVTDTPASVSTTLMRASVAGDATVSLSQATTTPEAFSVPSTLTFADGSNTAELVIAIAPNLPVGVYSDTITVSPASVAASPTFVVKVTVKGASEPADWQRMSGKCTYRDDFVASLYGADCLTYKLDIDEDMNHPGVYRLVNPYGEAYPYNEPGDYDPSVDTYMVINAADPDRVYIEYTETATDWGYGNMMMWSFAGRYLDAGVSADEIAEAGYFGKLADGIITFPTKTLLVTEANESGWYYGNSNGKFAVALPGYSLGDYSIDASYLGKLVGTDGVEYAVGSVNALGKDVAAVKAGIVATTDAALAVEAVDGDQVETVTLTEVGTFQLPVGASGEYTLAFISYDADGGKCESLTIYVKFVLYGDLESIGWTSLGMATVTSNMLNALFSAPGCTYQVEIQEKDDTPGLYRLVNPYGAAYPYNEPGDYDASSNYFVEVDATDANCVIIPLQNTGMDWGYGFFHIYSLGAYYADQGNSKEVLAANGIGGTMADGVITFPAGELLLYLPAPAYEGLYNGNTAAASTIVLPTAAAAAPALAPAARTSVSHAIGSSPAKVRPVAFKAQVRPSRIKSAPAVAF